LSLLQSKYFRAVSREELSKLFKEETGEDFVDIDAESK
jgi:hypothetical protein